ncbi:MAG TPA: glycosyltransferase family 4 protein, partial [Bryobacteraceae bacterium]|nr:glycosyltransferase family 4 protein [Bryobacteraceae bacterium]
MHADSLHTAPGALAGKPQNAAPWVIVSTGIHDRGGQDKANFALAQYLLEQNVPVHLVSHSVDSRLMAYPGAVFHAVPKPPGPFVAGEVLLDRRGRAVARSVEAAYPGMRMVVNGGNCIWPGINWAHYVHHAWNPNRGATPAWYRFKSQLNHRWDKGREKKAYSAAQLVITNSESTRQFLLHHLSLDPARTTTVYLGCDDTWGRVDAQERLAARAAFDIPDSMLVASFIAGLGWDDRKGFDILRRAWAQLCRNREWNVILMVAGGGAALSKWKREAIAAGLEDRVRFLGFTGRVRELLAASDVMVSPVRYEPYGLNVQEAICRGVPTIVSHCAGAAERYPQDYGAMV